MFTNLAMSPGSSVDTRGWDFGEVAAIGRSMGHFSRSCVLVVDGMWCVGDDTHWAEALEDRGRGRGRGPSTPLSLPPADSAYLLDIILVLPCEKGCEGPLLASCTPIFGHRLAPVRAEPCGSNGKTADGGLAS